MRAPYVGDLVEAKGLLIGEAAAYCPTVVGGMTLLICLKHGVVPAMTIPQQPCTEWPSRINRVDGYTFQPCREGFWRTYAAVVAGGAVIQDGHSEVVEMTAQECITGTASNLPGSL